ncbi:MAG TPA: endolytic transglycosylase MltG [Candidatus Paceibacterota bacterium]
MIKLRWLAPLFSRRYLLILLIFVGVIFLIHLFFLSPPSDFQNGLAVTVSEGSSIVEIATLLADKHLIRSPFVLEYLIRFARSAGLSSNKTGVAVAGDYVFPRPENVVIIARRLARGQYGIAPIKLTIPEGANSYDIAASLAQLIPTFDATAFIAAAQPREGYLFPNTYYFQSTWLPERMIGAMEKEFRASTKSLAPLIANSGRTLEQIVIMASLLEREAHTTEARQMIAGILWQRLDAGMPLQVDATFAYISDKNTFELSLKDLATSSPYNTYRYRGLPIGSIANPGLDALTAALTPIKSDYWFYLSDQSGNLHYAVDFEEHKLNKARYLP